MFSIDQNCHSLWDVLPKLQALAAKGHRVTHFIEDIDVAFTSLGSSVSSSTLRLVRERFHRSGGADWGAALFYSEFLGRLPVEIRQWEAQTGMKTAALARQLGCSVDDLYEEFSPSDNWQLIGPSYVGDREHHRVVGDLGVAETAGFLRQILALGRENCLASFPQADSRERLREWFDRERERLDALIEGCRGGRLVELYRQWLGSYVGSEVRLELMSSLFQVRTEAPGSQLMGLFASQYERAARLYNASIEETGVGLRTLDTAEGELPFFATLEHDGHQVRTTVYLKNGAIRIGDRRLALKSGQLPAADDLARAGVSSLVGKAIILAIQVRLGEAGQCLALPYRGSLYMPAAHRFAEKLDSAGLLPGALKPLLRVRLGLLDHMKSIETIIHLPAHLAACFGCEEIPARRLGDSYESLAAEASARLDAFREEQGRSRWQRDNCPEIWEAIAGLDRRRRDLAREEPKSSEIRQLGQEQKQLRRHLLRRLVEQIAQDTQVAQIDYWDSRGALLPWCIGLGGDALYNRVIRQAKLYEEPHKTSEVDE